MSVTSTLVQEKLDQAVGILREQDVDLWLTFVRETSLTNDPCLDLIAGTYSAWTGAFLVAANGERIAIVGRFDAPAVEQLTGCKVKAALSAHNLEPDLAAELFVLDRPVTAAPEDHQEGPRDA